MPERCPAVYCHDRIGLCRAKCFYGGLCGVMTESYLWGKLRDALAGFNWTGDRIESKTGNGIADVAYSVPEHHGWIELKTGRTGKGSDPIVTLNHNLSARQVKWLENRQKKGGFTFILVAVDIERQDHYFLMPVRQAKIIKKGGRHLSWWLRMAVGHWSGTLNGRQLYGYLRSRS